MRERMRPSRSFLVFSPMASESSGEAQALGKVEGAISPFMIKSAQSDTSRVPLLVTRMDAQRWAGFTALCSAVRPFIASQQSPVRYPCPVSCKEWTVPFHCTILEGTDRLC